MKNAKLFAMGIVTAMVLSVLAGLGSFAAGLPVSPHNDRHLEISATTLNVVHVGDQNFDFDVTISNDAPGGDATDDDPIRYCNLTISSTVRDEMGSTVTSPISNWDDDTVNDNVNIYDWGGNTFNNFIFDVAGNAVPGTYNLTVTLSFKNETGTAGSYTGYILFDVEARAEVADIGGLIPGDKNKNIQVMVTPNQNWGAGEEMTDIFINITRPDASFSWFGTTTATQSAFWSGAMINAMHGFPFTISVSPIKNAGTYVGSYTVEYTNEDGVRCYESGSEDFQVGHLAMLSATSTTTSIVQGANKVDVSITLKNTGTVDLYAIKLTIDPQSDAFTFLPADHWEGSSTVSYAWLEVGNVVVGGTVTKTFTIGFSTTIPEGMHKIMFGFEGYYFDPITMSYLTVREWWTGTPNHPVVTMNSVDNHLNPQSSSVAGTYLNITIIDSKMDITITSTVTLSKGGKLMDNDLTMSVDNYGNIDYDNVILQIQTNTATSPFLNVVSPTAPLSEETNLGWLGAGQTEDANLKVTLKQGATMGVFMVPVTIRAINSDLGTVVNTTIDARITIRGVGPKLEITTVSPKTVNPGSSFTLVLTIENGGDDTARNVVLWTENQASGGITIVTSSGNSEENGDLNPPSAVATPMMLPDIAPGANVTVSIAMKSNADMSSGHVFDVTFGITYVDSFGVAPSDAETYHTVAVKSSGWGGSVWGNFILALTILTIIVMICVIVIVVVWVRKQRAAKKMQQMAAQHPGVEHKAGVQQGGTFQTDNPPPPPQQ